MQHVCVAPYANGIRLELTAESLQAIKLKRSTLHGALSEKGHYAEKRPAAKKTRSAGSV